MSADSQWTPIIPKDVLDKMKTYSNAVKIESKEILKTVCTLFELNNRGISMCSNLALQIHDYEGSDSMDLFLTCHIDNVNKQLKVKGYEKIPKIV